MPETSEDDTNLEPPNREEVEDIYIYPGIDEIPAEMLKYGVDLLKWEIYELILERW